MLTYAQIRCFLSQRNWQWANCFWFCGNGGSFSTRLDTSAIWEIADVMEPTDYVKLIGLHVQDDFGDSFLFHDGDTLIAQP